MKSGIYKILNTTNNKFYIGSAINIDIRFIRHKSTMKLNKHVNRLLQRSFNKYGADVFEFHIVEYCEKEKLIEREQFYIDTLRPEYNLAPKAGNSLGVKHTKETKKKMSIAKQNMSKYTKELFSKLRKGKKLSDQHKINIANSMKGRIVSLETKLKISKSNLGKTPSEETKNKIRLTTTGRKRGKYNKKFMVTELISY